MFLKIADVHCGSLCTSVKEDPFICLYLIILIAVNVTCHIENVLASHCALWVIVYCGSSLYGLVSLRTHKRWDWLRSSNNNVFWLSVMPSANNLWEKM